MDVQGGEVPAGRGETVALDLEVMWTSCEGGRGGRELLPARALGVGAAIDQVPDQQQPSDQVSDQQQPTWGGSRLGACCPSHFVLRRAGCTGQTCLLSLRSATCWVGVLHHQPHAGFVWTALIFFHGHAASCLASATVSFAPRCCARCCGVL